MKKAANTPELFRYIEDSYDIGRIRYKGLNMWPLLRKGIGLHLDPEVPADNYEAPVARQHSFVDTLKAPLRARKLSLAKKRFLSSIPLFDAQYLFCTYPDAGFTDQLDKKQFSRYLDPYYEVLQDAYKLMRFSVRTEQAEGIDSLYPSHYLDLSDYKDYFYLREFIMPANDQEAVQYMQAVLNEINGLVHHEYGIRPAYSGIIRQFEEVMFYKEFTDAFLQKNSHVKVIFMHCFYDAFKLALVASAKQKGISIVEIQHGTAEDNLYVPYTKPAVDMDLLPGYLWCWSHSDCELIGRYNSATSPYLKPFVGGNMWLKKFVTNEMPVPSEHAAFISAVKLTYNKIVLLNLQLSIGLVDVMFDTISHAPKDVFFLVRFHPLTSAEEQQEVQSRLRRFDNIETSMASSIHLYHLFSHIDFQVTHSSEAAMESLSFKVPTIICSIPGYDFYKTQVDQQVLFFADKAEDILQIISGEGELNSENVEHFLMQVDPQQALNSFGAALAVPSN